MKGVQLSKNDSKTLLTELLRNYKRVKKYLIPVNIAVSNLATFTKCSGGITAPFGANLFLMYNLIQGA